VNLLFLGALAWPAAGEDPAAPQGRWAEQQALAERVDQALYASWTGRGVTPTAVVGDAAFLRRLSLDLCGTIPTRQEVEEFLQDRRPDKRSRKIDEYLGDRAWAETFSSLWTELMLESATRRQEARELRPWLEEEFVRGTPFDQIVRTLVGARGRNDELGATGFGVAYGDQPEGIAAVTAKAFLGLQIQCAQCHDHPYDDWTQRDFEGFAAFFTPMRTRRIEDGGERSTFQLYDVDRDEQRRDRLRRLAALVRRQRMDGDPPPGEDEADVGAPLRRGADMDRRATGRLLRRSIDGELDEAGLERLIGDLPEAVQMRIRKVRENEEKYGEPRFLGAEPYQSVRGRTPREALADWIVDPDNPYFGAAVVNRLWGHFFGKGLTEPVDDLTGSQDAILPELLDLLSVEFHAHDTDLSFLMGALVRTRAYALAPLTEQAGQTDPEQVERWFAAHPVRKLSAEQMLHSLLRATGVDQYASQRRRGRDFEAVRDRILTRFRYAFSDDEAGEENSFTAGIPEALFLINGRLTNPAQATRRNPMIDGILDDVHDDRGRLEQLFYATLGRPPTRREAGKLGKLMRVSDRYRNGMEDLCWALLNSSEFLTNH
jgi:hypothetical protein